MAVIAAHWLTVGSGPSSNVSSSSSGLEESCAGYVDRRIPNGSNYSSLVESRCCAQSISRTRIAAA